MQNFYEWFLEQIEFEEIIPILKSMKVRVAGFRDLGRAPKPLLINELRKTQKQDKDFMPKLIQAIGTMSNGILELPEMNFRDFLQRVKYEPDLKAYEIFAILFVFHGNEFQEHMDCLLENAKEGNPLWINIIEETEDPFEKLQHIFHVTKEQDKTIQDLLKKWERECELIDPKEDYTYLIKYREVKLLVDGSEENLVQVLQSGSLLPEERYIAFLAFLNCGDNALNPKYNGYIDYVLRCMGKNEIQFFISENNQLGENYKSLQSEAETLKNKNLSLKESLLQSKEKVKEQKYIEEELSILRQKDQQSTLIWKMIEKKLSRLPFVIVTKEEDVMQFPSNLFKEVYSLHSFKEKSHNEAWIQEKIFFINRTICKTTSEWRILQAYLDEKNLNYTEVTGYGIDEHMEQIFSYFSQPEGVEVR